MAKVKAIAIGGDRVDIVDKTAFDEEVTKREQGDVTLQASINSKVGDLTTLDTTNKDSLVEAINEIAGKSGGTVDLSNYYNKTETNNLLNDKATVASVNAKADATALTTETNDRKKADTAITEDIKQKFSNGNLNGLVVISEADYANLGQDVIQQNALFFVY